MQLFDCIILSDETLRLFSKQF